MRFLWVEKFFGDFGGLEVCFGGGSKGMVGGF